MKKKKHCSTEGNILVRITDIMWII